MGSEGGASREEAACLDSGVLGFLGILAGPLAWGKDQSVNSNHHSFYSLLTGLLESMRESTLHD